MTTINNIGGNIHKGSELEKRFLASGHVLAVIGILILLLSIIPFPYTTSDVEEDPHSSVWLDKSFAVPACSSVWLNESFFLPALTNNSDNGTFSYLQIEFSATADGLSDIITFQAVDETDYLKMRAGEPYQDLGYPSQYNVTSESAQWVPPNGTKIYFVWVNSFLENKSKSVSASFTLNWMKSKTVEKTKSRTLLPSEAELLGALVLIIGLLWISYGLVSKPPSARLIDPVKKNLHSGFVRSCSSASRSSAT